MAKDKDVLDSVLKRPSTSEGISRLIDDQSEDFPSVSDIQISQPYIDPFSIPKWCDTTHYAFAWIDPKDDIQRHRAMDVGYFRIVTRSSSCIKGKISERDFRDHGAVERQGMILMFRPKDLDERMRTFPVRAHEEMQSTLQAGKQEAGFEVTHTKFQGDFSKERDLGSGSGKLDVVAFEEAGEAGIKRVESI